MNLVNDSIKQNNVVFFSKNNQVWQKLRQNFENINNEKSNSYRQSQQQAWLQSKTKQSKQNQIYSEPFQVDHLEKYIRPSHYSTTFINLYLSNQQTSTISVFENFTNKNTHQMKGNISLNPSYKSYQIRPLSLRILYLTPFIACDQHHLYYKPERKASEQSLMRTCRWDDKPIVNCTYIKKYNLIMALCQNYKVYVLTQNLQEVSVLSGWQSKYTLAFQFIQEYNFMLLIGPESVQVMRVSIDTNVKKTKFLSSMKFSLKKINPQPVAIPLSLPWNKGFNINLAQNLLYVFSPQSVSFIQLSTQQVLSQSHSLTKKQHPITSILFSPAYKYTLTGTSNGQIRIWRLALSKQFQHESILIHTFESHSRPVKQLMHSKNSEKVFLSNSEDMVVCFWSLETFEMLRKFQLHGVYSEVMVKNVQMAYVVKDGVVGEMMFGQQLEFIMEVASNVVMVDRQRLRRQEDKYGSGNTVQGESLTETKELLKENIQQSNQIIPQPNPPCSLGTIALTLEQNISVVIQKSLLLPSKQLNKMQTKYIYPPLKAKSIKQLLSSPYNPQVYYLLAQNGEIFRVLVPPFSSQYIGVSSKIEEVFHLQMSVDKEKHPLNQLPTTIGFFDVLPVEFDSEIREVEETGQKSFREATEKKFGIGQAINKFLDLKLICLGCEKGSVVFVSCSDMAKLYCRLTYHRERILQVQAFKQYKSDQFNPLNALIASYCAQNYMKIIKFDHEKSSAACILTYYAGEELKLLRSLENYLAVVFYKGQFQITEIDLKGKSEEFCCRRSSNVQNHEGQILAIDYESKLQLVMTAGSDNRIKLWTAKKILVWDVVMDQGLRFAMIVQRNDAKRKQNLAKSNEEVVLAKDPKQKNKGTNQVDNQKPTSVDPLEQKFLALLNRPRPEPVNFDMMILHEEKLLYFHHIPLSFRPHEIQSYNTNPELLDQQKVTLREVLQSYSQKSEEKGKYKGESINMGKISEKRSQQRKERIQTEPSFENNGYKERDTEKRDKGIGDKRFFGQSQIKLEESISMSPETKKYLKFKTETSIDQQVKGRASYMIRSVKKSKSKKTQSNKQSSLYKSPVASSYQPIISQSSLDATRKHIMELQSLKSQINNNRPFLPSIRNKKQEIFDQFMKQKLLNKNVLTRRDITINRIIMKNIIKEHMTKEREMNQMMKLDF